MTIRTRFAPSPTGYLHIGGVRTALFNWLLTRRHGGTFVLRIDDTDAERNRPEALQPILDGFHWLGIDWDEGPEVGGPCGPYVQSQRQHLYVEAALKLIDSGHAYPDYKSADEISAERKEAEKAKRNYIYRGAHRSTPPAECRRLYDAQRTVIRLKVPEGKPIVINDLICGKVEVQPELVGDSVILRADGRALYNFATVVDDVAMKITHIVRAKEHLSNTPVQVLAYEALNYPVPQFAHVPVVNAPKSKEKLSKRKMKQFMTDDVVQRLRAAHAVPPDWTDEQIKNSEDLNPATVAFYRVLGYLPAALVNYFGRLGWSLDDKTEIMPLATMIENFSLERVNDSPASFDPDKLLWMAGEYMKQLPIDDKVAGVIPFLRRANLIGDEVDDALRRKIRKVIEACGDRLKVYSDVYLYASFLFRDPEYDPKAVKQRLHKDGIREHLTAFADVLKTIEPFEPAVLEEKLKEYCDARQFKLGDLNHALRVATTGVMVGVSVFDGLAILGRDETLRRIGTALGLNM
ncbi:MAG: glutamate--tRNA ligase [Gemmataceae bacterium]|nr:glutamate--tRNA ligase [Gemmataceae bacterium]